MMVTLTFLIIAYAIRKRFLAEDASRGDKVLYYLFSVVMTPLIGPWFFKVLIESKAMTPEEEKNHRRFLIGTYPGFLS